MNEPLDDKHFDLLLKEALDEVPASPWLAERIIAHAKAMPQQRGLPWRSWISVLFEDLRLPAPAYVLASVLLLGFLTAYLGNDQQMGFSSDPVAVSDVPDLITDEATL